MITLFHSPLTCSLASKFALIESGLEHRIEIINTAKGANLEPAYLAINPAGKVPALAVDGRVVTESTAILPLIADLAPGRGLMPEGPLERAEAQSLLSFLSSTVHAAWTRVLRPERFIEGDEVARVRDPALRELAGALTLLEARMQGRTYLVGDLTVCDLYLTVFLAWRMAPPAQGRLPSTPALDALQARVFGRPMLSAAFAEDLALRNAA